MNELLLEEEDINDIEKNFNSNNNEHNKIKIGRQKMNDVKNVMFDNVVKVTENFDKDETSQKFDTQSIELKKKLWWKNCKTKMYISLVVCFVIVIIILVIVFNVNPK
jgi:hypothetical protein